MNIFHMAFREMVHRKGNFLLGVLAVGMATATFVGAVAFLNIYDIRSETMVRKAGEENKQTMASLKEAMRKATLELNFNLLILPKDQNLKDFYADDYASKYMPEDYAEKLAKSGIIVVRHFFPTLHQKIKWPEIRRTIILAGTRGEVPNQFKSSRKPLVQSVPPGTIVLGHELHQSLGLKAGDKVTLMGRVFTVHQCHLERGNKDDITAWIYLGDAQELLGRQGQINAVLAVNCLCVVKSAATVRQEIEKILPGTQVVEMETRMLARQESRLAIGTEAEASVERMQKNRKALRKKREIFMSVVIPLVMTACLAWVGLLAFHNGRIRRHELGILRAIGVRSRQIMGLVILKVLAMGCLGGGTGFLAGLMLGIWAGVSSETSIDLTVRITEWFDPALLGIALGVAVAGTMLAAWIPVVLAVRSDPAMILREK